MNDYRVLRVFCEQDSLWIERVHVVFGYLTMIFPVIRGWIEQK